MRSRSRQQQWYEIVGVVADLQTNAIDPTLVDANVFHMLDPGQTSVLTLIVRTRGGDAGNVAGKVRSILGTLDPTARITPRPMLELYRQMDLAVRDRHAGDWLDHSQRAAALGRRDLRVDVVHGVAAEKGDWHSRRDGRRCEALADQHFLEGGGPARRRRRGRNRIRRGARRGQQRRRARHGRASRCSRSSRSRWSSSGYRGLRPGAARSPAAAHRRSSGTIALRAGLAMRAAGAEAGLRSLSLTTTNVFV